MPRRNLVVFSALLILVVSSCSSARAQEAITTSTAPVQASAPTSAMTVAPEALVVSEALTALAPAVRVSLPPPEPPPDPLDGYYGRYRCRFATAGRVTPCCPEATEILAQFWQGEELAIADYIIGRESGCNAAIRNSVGCIGWWQMCGKSCPPDGCGDAWSATTKARQLYDNRRWCDWYLSGDPVTGHAC